MARATVAFLALALGAASASSEGMSPTQKVIELLNGMVEKGKKEKHEEQVQFAQYKQFCDDTTASKQKSIKQANEKISVLQADIEKAAADAEELGQQIAQHDEDISTWGGDKRASAKVREFENQDYLAAHQDYTESIQAIDDGIATLKKEAGDVAQGGA